MRQFVDILHYSDHMIPMWSCLQKVYPRWWKMSSIVNVLLCSISHLQFVMAAIQKFVNQIVATVMIANCELRRLLLHYDVYYWLQKFHPTISYSPNYLYWVKIFLEWLSSCYFIWKCVVDPPFVEKEILRDLHNGWNEMMSGICDSRQLCLLSYVDQVMLSMIIENTTY